jgi:proteasome accessory factor A
MLCRDRIDWVAKKELLGTLRNEEKLSWTDPWLQSIDLEYHNILPEAGLYYELLRQGAMRPFVTEAEIKQAIFAPPADTRAYFRGRSVARFNSQIKSVQWDEMVFADGAAGQRVRLTEPNDNPRLAALNTAAREAADYRKFIRTVSAL